MGHIASTLSEARTVISGPIARSAISGMVLRLSGMALLFAQAILAAQMLGAERYGIVSILLAIAHVAAVVVLCGFANFAVAEIPRRIQEGVSGVVPAFLHHSFSRAALACLLVLPITGVVILAILDDAPPLIALLGVAIVPLLAALQLLRGVALGLERPIQAQLPIEIVRPTLFLTALITLWLTLEVNTLNFLVFYIASAVAALLIAGSSVKTGGTAAGPANPQEAAALTSEWDRATLPFLGMHLAAILQVELATLMLGIFASPEAAGLFQPIGRISVVLLLPAYALNLRFNPRIASLHAQGQQADIARLSRKYTWASMAVMIAVGIAIGLASPWLLLLFGQEFVVGVPLVWIVVAGRIAMTAFGPALPLLTMMGQTGKALSATALSVVVEVVLAAVLILNFGLMGAAFAVAAGMSVRGLLLALVSKRACGIGLRAFWGIDKQGN